MLDTPAAIRAALKTKLLTISAFQSRVYDYREANAEGYPAVSFDVSDTNDDFETNRDNMRKIAWKIVIFQEAAVKGIKSATAELDDLTQQVISTLENDFNLSNGGAADGQFWCDPVKFGLRDQFQSAQGLVYYQELTLTSNFAVLVS